LSRQLAYEAWAKEIIKKLGVSETLKLIAELEYIIVSIKYEEGE
jgi:hypothetical protein